MTLPYGYVKCKVMSEPKLVGSKKKHETQYHLRTTLQVGSGSGGGHKNWDSAVNVGTNDADDLLRYKLVYDFQHPIRDQLSAAAAGFHDQTGKSALPALDFLRSDVLANTGPWRDSDVMDGSGQQEPVASLKRLLERAKSQHLDVYVFGRTYKTGLGVHDVHMNQGSTGSFVNDGRDDHNDHNDVWQDGAVLVDLGEGEWAAYFTAFTQQTVPTDKLGNPEPNGEPIGETPSGS